MWCLIWNVCCFESHIHTCNNLLLDISSQHGGLHHLWEPGGQVSAWEEEEAIQRLALNMLGEPGVRQLQGRHQCPASVLVSLAALRITSAQGERRPVPSPRPVCSFIHTLRVPNMATAPAPRRVQGQGDCWDLPAPGRANMRNSRFRERELASKKYRGGDFSINPSSDL